MNLHKNSQTNNICMYTPWDRRLLAIWSKIFCTKELLKYIVYRFKKKKLKNVSNSLLESDWCWCRPGHRGRPSSWRLASPRISSRPSPAVGTVADIEDAVAVMLLVQEQAPPSIATRTDCISFWKENSTFSIIVDQYQKSDRFDD